MIAHKIIPLFPKHDLYIELFFGASGMFFKKPKAKYNICNDIDDDIFNLFMILQDEEQRKKLYDYMKLVPYSESLLRYWKKNKEDDPIKKAGRFLFLSNYTFGNMGNGMCIGFSNMKQILLDRLDELDYEFICDVQFMNNDFKKVLRVVEYEKRDIREADKTFIYADPPYMDTDAGYSSKWYEQDTIDLFDLLTEFGNRNNVKFAISEFDNPKVIALAEKYNLQVNIIGERRNLMNRRTEILITNYDTSTLIKKDLFNS